ncbi:excinuclease ABC subunit UvrC [Thiobacter aerophilum]|uniref:UvrABC system protein C n=1 Tax=Thiobacter aerophilum TaxID=3121275 RepID=A0ABN0F4V7_9BURK
MFDPTECLAGLPHLPGVYRMLGVGGEVLYVGKARDLKKRVSSYFQKTQLSPRIQLMLTQVASIEVTVTRSEAEALLLENNLIKGLAPKYNILFRDDKSYPSVVLTGHAFPRLALHRGPQRKGDRYFGPYPSAHAVRESLQLLQKVFRLRTCEDGVFSHRSRPCLLYQIKRCSGPCVGAISKADYARDVERASEFLLGREQQLLSELERLMLAASETQAYEEAAFYRDLIQKLRTVQERQFVESGRRLDADVVAVAAEGGVVCVNLTMIRAGRHLGDKSFFPQNAAGHAPSQIIEAFLAQHYAEQAAPPLILVNEAFESDVLAELLTSQAGRRVQIVSRPAGERRVWLEMAAKNAQLAIHQRLSQQTAQQERLAALREVLELPDSVHRIECFDISHTLGEATVAACVVYDALALKPSEYRRFNIGQAAAGDDYAAMREALTRRYRRLTAGEGKLPDLLLIDGGKGQVGVAREVLADLGVNDVEVVGVAKGPQRKPGLEILVFADQRKPLQLRADHPGLHLIQQIRDEAHRFAITGHRARRGKARIQSLLDGIPGVGPKRRQMLLTRFGGVKGVRNASIDELAKVEGISRALAEKIYAELH